MTAGITHDALITKAGIAAQILELDSINGMRCGVFILGLLLSLLAAVHVRAGR